jgi:hypothetical protein
LRERAGRARAKVVSAAPRAAAPVEADAAPELDVRQALRMVDTDEATF